MSTRQFSAGSLPLLRGELADLLFRELQVFKRQAEERARVLTGIVAATRPAQTTRRSWKDVTHE